jgi:hypothetical protein
VTEALRETHRSFGISTLAFLLFLLFRLGCEQLSL